MGNLEIEQVLMAKSMYHELILLNQLTRKLMVQWKIVKKKKKKRMKKRKKKKKEKKEKKKKKMMDFNLGLDGETKVLKYSRKILTISQVPQLLVEAIQK